MSPKRNFTPPSHVDEALRRSAQHARNAIAEALLAGHALLDAVALATTGRAASARTDETRAHLGHSGLASLAERIRLLATSVRGREADLPEDWTHAILEALDQEISRWEEQSRGDPDARAVLRAFIGLRELLWEFGLRDSQATDSRKPSSESRRPKTDEDRGRSERVQRIKVEG